MNDALWLSIAFALATALTLPQWRYMRRRGPAAVLICALLATCALVFLLLGLMPLGQS